MKIDVRSFGLGIAAAIVLAVILNVARTSAQVAVPADRPRWQYKCQEASYPDDVSMSNLGKDGWELVTITHVREGAFVCVFKRKS
jgi:hypothetical protein